MKGQTCASCGEYRHCKDTRVSWIFFAIGLVATVAVRLVVVAQHYHALAGKIAWYVGVFGFLVFFLYKYRVDTARARTIRRKGLVAKIRGKERLSEEDYGLLADMMCAISSRKDRINYFFIFATSVAVLVVAVFLDLSQR